MKAFILVLGFIFLSLGGMGQGKLMLVGGGSEDYGSWSDQPYQWAVDQSANKRVAVISYSDQSEWIPDYFTSLGALAADNIKISSRAIADQDSTYELLMSYDVFFFKGGDQSNYYEYYKDTRTAQAVIDKFADGGVITGTSAGMAILSGVIFSAERGSVYPDEALKDYHNKDITLKDDLFPFLPGILADSHFTERGRIGRMMAFLANWHDLTNSYITGIGVDDRTALCIDSGNTGTVYGTGSVSVFLPGAISSHEDAAPVADSIHMVQLLHGHSLNMNTLETLSGPDNPTAPTPPEENGNYQVLLSGSDPVSENDGFLDKLVNDTGVPEDTVILVTRPGGAQEWITALGAMNTPVVVLETGATNNDTEAFLLRNQIRRSNKILFADNQDNSLLDFLNGGDTGELLREHIERNHMIVAFAGGDSRYAGKLFVTGYLTDPYDAYYGDLTYAAGLGLLKTTVVMPNTFDAGETDYYENTTASVTYAMAHDSLRYGIYLNRNSYVYFYQENDKNYFSASGAISTLMLSNDGEYTALADQPVNAAGDHRNYAGFSTMTIKLLNGTRMAAGIPVPTTDIPYEYEEIVTGIETGSSGQLNIFPNPSRGWVTVASDNGPWEGWLKIRSMTGQTLKQLRFPGSISLDLSDLPVGSYILSIFRQNGNITSRNLLLTY